MRRPSKTSVPLSVKPYVLGWILITVSITLSLFWGEELSAQESALGLIEGPDLEHPRSVVMWWIRLPRLITALVAGAALSITGAAMQNLMRNDLADPYLLGVASGGGLGAALAISLGLIDRFGLWTLPLLSFVGALTASLWADRAARAVGLDPLGLDTRATNRLVLSGVALNLFLSALLTLTLALSEERLSGVWRWLIGHVEGLSWRELSVMCLISSVGSILLYSQRRALDVLPAGEEVAWTLGIEVKRARSSILIAIALAVSAVVAHCGVIGFIGLLVPHMIRPHIIGASHRLLALSALYGASALALCDVLSRVGPRAVPVGVITGVIGGAVFLYMQRVSAR